MNQPTTPADAVGKATLDAVSRAGKFNYWMYQQVKPYLKGNVLEVGSGTGNISSFIAADGFNTVLSDIQPAYADLLTRKFSDTSSIKGVLQIDMQDPQFTTRYASLKGSFDAICMLNVIEHLSDDRIAVANCRFLLKDKGHLILLAPAYSFLFCQLDRNLGHFRRYTTRSLAKVCADNGFTILQQRYFNIAGIAGWLVSGKILGSVQLQPGQMKLFDNLMPLVKLADAMCLNRAGLSAIVAAQK